MNENLPDLTDEHTQAIIAHLKGSGGHALSLLVNGDDDDGVRDVDWNFYPRGFIQYGVYFVSSDLKHQEILSNLRLIYQWCFIRI